MNIDGLLSREEQAWAGLLEASAQVSPDRRRHEGVVPGWSLHDVVWHCVYWAEFGAKTLDQIRVGAPEPPEEPEEAILATGRRMSWDEVLERAGLARERARASLRAFGGDAPDPAAETFAGETVEHYEGHAAEIRAFA